MSRLIDTLVNKLDRADVREEVTVTTEIATALVAAGYRTVKQFRTANSTILAAALDDAITVNQHAAIKSILIARRPA